jgi:SacI homology domain
MLKVFWEQQGLQTFGHRIQLTRPHASQPAFERHFTQLIEQYGAVHAVNLLGSKENEAILTSAYDRHLQVASIALGEENIGITHFDFHNAVRIGGHESMIRDLPSVLDGLYKRCCIPHIHLGAWRVSLAMWIVSAFRCATLLRMRLLQDKTVSSE